MARQLLTHGLLALGLTSLSCRAERIDVVVCATDADCAPSGRCTSEHTCVEDDLLVWDATGRVRSSENRHGIDAQWVVVDDCSNVEEATASGAFVCSPEAPTPGCCARRDPALTWLGESGVSASAGVRGESSGSVCVKGQATRVDSLENGELAFGVQWGLALELVFGDGSGFDATSGAEGGGISGFQVDILGPPSARPIRFGVMVVDVATPYFGEVQVPALGATARFDEVALGEWVEPRTPFDETRLQALQVTMAPIPEEATPFELCLQNLRVLE